MTKNRFAELANLLPPMSIMLTHSRKKVAKALRELGVESQCQGVLKGKDATTMICENGDTGECLFVVYMSPNLEWTAEQDIGLLAHEATHIVRAYLESIGETLPSEEMQAYLTGAVVQDLCGAHFAWKKKRLKRKRGA